MERKRIDEEIKRFQNLDKSVDSVEDKLEELLFLLENSNLDSKSVTEIQEKFNNALEQNKLSADDLKRFQEIDGHGASRLEMADNLEGLLSNYKLDSRVSKKFLLMDKVIKLIKIVAGIVLLALGYSMIVMPATPSFEMYTIFYFSADDGVTLMDLISLLIVLAGVYLFVTSVVKINKQD